MSTIKVDTVRPVTADASLTLQGDNSGTGVSGITIDSSGNATFAQTISGGTIGSSVVFPAGGTGNPISVAVIGDEKSSGTNGGSLTSGDWRDRELNTEFSDPDSIVSISSNQFTLAAGTYVIEWSCPGFRVSAHKTQLYDVTGTQVLAVGRVAFSNSADTTNSDSTGAFLHTINSNNTYKIQHQASVTRSNDGFGAQGGFSTVEVYTIVKISKLK